jgi:hypothetical protein
VLGDNNICLECLRNSRGGGGESGGSETDLSTGEEVRRSTDISSGGARGGLA